MLVLISTPCYKWKQIFIALLIHGLSGFALEQENPLAFLWNQECNRKSVKSGFNSLCYACDFPEKQKQTDFLFIVQNSRPVISRGKKGKDVTAHYSAVWHLCFFIVCKIPGKGFTLTNLCKHLSICLFSNSAWRELLCSGDCGQKGWCCTQPCIYLFSNICKNLFGS